VNDVLDVLAALALPDGRRWGAVAGAFQWDDARAVLDPDGRPYQFLTRPRGGSKTTDLAAISVAAMVAQLPPGSRLYAIASDRDQGRLLVDAVEGFAVRTPMLHGMFDVQSFRVVHVPTGSVLVVLAADAPGAWGLLPDFVVVDEIAQWATTAGPRRLWEAVSSSVAKNASARMAVLTTAGDPAHWSYGVLEHARSDPLWRVNEVPGPVPWADPSRLAEQRRALLESSYARLHMNVWTAAEDRLATPEDVAACVTLDGPQEPAAGRAYLIGLDLGVKHDRSVAAVAHAEPVDGGVRVALDRMQVWAGTRDRPVRLSDVGQWVTEASRRYGRARVVMDPWQGMALAQDLRGHGIGVEEFTFSSASVGRLATTMHLLVRDHLLAIPDDPALIEELSNVRLRETSPGVVRMDHDPDKHDDRAIALSLAAHRLVERPVTAALGTSAVVSLRRSNLALQRVGPGWRSTGTGARGWPAR
jgi:phage terminase large subunit-like protein